MAKTDPRIDKRRVTMTNVIVVSPEETYKHVATDYVRPDFLDAYVADAKTRWQFVEVSDEPDAGPAGYDGDTVIPAQIDGKAPEDFAVYGDHTTPENALDELLVGKES